MTKITETKQDLSSAREIVRFGNFEMDVEVTQVNRIESFKVGDAVKLLKKKGSYNQASTMAGVIVGFDNFESSPAIVVLTMEQSYSDVNFSFITITSESEDYDMIHYSGYEQLFTRDNVMRIFDRKIAEAEMKLNEMNAKRSYFDQKFASAFEKVNRVDFSN
jgi:hypothetical protein